MFLAPTLHIAGFQTFIQNSNRCADADASILLNGKILSVDGEVNGKNSYYWTDGDFELQVFWEVAGANADKWVIDNKLGDIDYFEGFSEYPWQVGIGEKYCP